MAQIKFDQVGLESPGEWDKTRTDGASNGQEITVTTSEPGLVELLWAPVDDDGVALASLHQVSPTVWKFTPNDDIYGTYRVRFTPTSNPLLSTIRLFSILTPNFGLRIPALNERSDPNASLINNGPTMVAASEFNKDGEGTFTDGDYGGSYTAFEKLILVVDQLGEGGGTVSTIESASPNALSVTNPAGPTVQLTLHLGTASGELAAGADLAAAEADIVAAEASLSALSGTVGGHTTSIATLTSGQSTLTSSLSSHTSNTSNPHTTTKAQVGLTNVTDDAQLKRANNDWSGYSAITVPTLSDKLLSEIAAGGVKGTLAISALVTLIKAQLRDPIWDAPTTGTVDDDEFTADTVASGAWTATLSNGVAMVRDGAVDPTQACASGHYRSSVVGGVLVLQIRQNESVFFHKTVAAALSTNQLWMLGVGMPTEPGTGSANNPAVSFGLYRNNAGFLDFQNRSLVRTGSSTERIESLGVIANTPNTSSTNSFTLVSMDGLALRIDHGSAAAGNMCAFGYRRSGALTGYLQNNGVQFNLSTDRVAFNLLSNSAGTLAGANNALFTLHHMRRVAASNPGFLAQA